MKIQVLLVIALLIPLSAASETPQELRMKGVQYAVQEDFENAEKYLCEAARTGFYTAQVECAYLLESSPEPVRNLISAYAWAELVIHRDGTDSDFARDIIRRVENQLDEVELEEAKSRAKEYVEKYEG